MESPMILLISALAILIPSPITGKVFLPRTCLSTLPNNGRVGAYKSASSTKERYFGQSSCFGLNIRGGSGYSDEGRYYDYSQDNEGRRTSGTDDYKDEYSSRFSDPSDGRGKGDEYEEDKYSYDIRDDKETMNDDYYDKENPYSRSRPSKAASRQTGARTSQSFLPKNIPGIPLPNRKVGIMMIGSGSVITMLGISLFFNKTLLRLGNILFLMGVPLTIGTGRTMGFFLQPKKARATACLSFGIFMVLIGWPVIGISMEVFGLLNLFGNMFPLLLMMARNIPFLGDLLPDGKKKKKSGTSSRYSRDEYYRDQSYDDDEEERKNSSRYY